MNAGGTVPDLPTSWRREFSRSVRSSYHWLLAQRRSLQFVIGMAIGYAGTMILYNTFGPGEEGRDLARGFLAQVTGGALLLLIGLPLVRRQIVAEHWFGQKAETYADIIRHLGVIERWSDMQERGYDGDPSLDRRKAAELAKAKEESDRALARYREDTFLLPEQAIEHLEALDDAVKALLETDPSSGGWVFGYGMLARSCADAMRKTAETELGIPDHLRGRTRSPLRDAADKLRASPEWHAAKPIREAPPYVCPVRHDPREEARKLIAWGGPQYWMWQTERSRELTRGESIRP